MLAATICFTRHLTDNARQGDSAGLGNQHEVKAHVLAKLAQLIFNRALRRWIVGVSKQQLDTGFERRILTRDAQKPAVLKITLGVNGSNRLLALPQGCAKPVAHSRLHQLLDHPEAARQQNRERDKAQQKRAGSEARYHCEPPPGFAFGCSSASWVESASTGIKKSALSF